MFNPTLTEKEVEFLLELLEAESTKLMRETRHVDVREVRDEMRERMRMADRLTERFNQEKSPVATP